MHILSEVQLDTFILDYHHYKVVKLFDTSLRGFFRKQPELKNISIEKERQSVSSETLRDVFKWCPKLMAFSWHDEGFSKKVFQDSEKQLCLTDLKVQSCSSFDDEALKILTSRCKNLKSIDVTDCFAITDEGLISISKNCMFLEKLVIGLTEDDQNSITGTGIEHIATGCPLLKTLKSQACSNIYDSDLILLSLSCKYLQNLTIHHCTEITDSALFAIGQNCKNIKKLSFSFSDHITSMGILALIMACRKLEKMKFKWCNGIKALPQNIDDFRDICPFKSAAFFETYCDKMANILQMNLENQKFSCHSHLKELNLKGCEFVTETTVLQLAQLCPDLRYIDIHDTCGTRSVLSQTFLDQLHSVCEFWTPET